MIDIQLCNVSKTYNPGLFKKKVNAVRGLSFEVRQGEVFGLIGPNGAGKSSTIRLLLGLTRPDSGEILFRGKPLKDNFSRRDIGYLPENPYLYDYLNLHELLHFCGRTSGLSEGQIIQRSHELADKLQLSEVFNRPLRTFSKGMLQRAGICFALLHDPDMVILDEPMSGLDPIGRKMVFDLIMELRQQGKTIFFCSHILSDVERLCDRIGLMAKGQLVSSFDRSDFLQNNSGLIHLLTTPLDDSAQEVLQPLVCKIRKEGGGHLIAVHADRFNDVSRMLREHNADIKGSRSEWVSLEDLFMKIIKEQDQ